STNQPPTSSETWPVASLPTTEKAGSRSRRKPRGSLGQVCLPPTTDGPNCTVDPQKTLNGQRKPCVASCAVKPRWDISCTKASQSSARTDTRDGSQNRCGTTRRTRR